MAGERLPNRESFKAAGDLSALTHTFVKLSAANTVTGAGAGEAGIGVLLNAPDAAGKTATVAMAPGIAQVKANGASPNIAVGNWLKVGANGVAVQSTTAKDHVVAIANEAATADGVIIEAILIGPMTLNV